MLEYFNSSQRVKREIEADEGLLKRISSALINSEGELVEKEGSHNKAYRIGQTKSGLCVALRVPIEASLEGYEVYCQLAAMSSRLYHKGKKNFLSIASSFYEGTRIIRPVDFCVGVMFEDEFGILTEDITEGGTVKFESSASEVVFKRFKDGKFLDYVLVDLDNISFKNMPERYWNHPQERPMYFAKENLLDLPFLSQTLE